MIPAPAPHPDDPALLIGMAAIVRLAYEGGDLDALLRRLTARVQHDPADAAALMDLSLLMQATSQRDKALELQTAALATRRVYHRPHGRADGLRVVAIVAPGDFMANTPIDLLLEGTDVDLWLVYIDAQTTAVDAPPHDVAFLAIGESAENLPILERSARLIAEWPAPVVNGLPGRISALTRDEVCQRMAGEPSILSPTTVRVARERLLALLEGRVTVDDLLPGCAFPLIVRPLGTHAGQGLEKLDDPQGLAAYLHAYPDDAFYLAPFIDYRSPDGLFRKQRIVFIDGRPFPSHYAVSGHWIVHYLSAQMAERPERRAEEEAWMGDFDTDFAVRHAAAFAALHSRLRLDYFGIDCAEAPDGRLLLFEADVAMIVHALDPADTFPYKKPAMRRLFDAFAASLAARAP